MAKKGIAQITGSKVLKLGEVGHYRVSKIHRQEDNSKVPHAKWKLYVKEKNNWRELKTVVGTPPKIGSKTTITITNQKLLGKELLLEAYLYEPEKSFPPGLIIKVEEGKKKIERVDLFRTDDSPISNGNILKYGQSIIVKVITVNIPNEKVLITLYEDDENGEGHSEKNERSKVDSVEKYLDEDGFAIHTFKLPIDFQRIANSYMDGSQDKYHEYYINVKSATDSKASDNINIPNPEYTFPEKEIEEVIISVKAKEIGTDPMPKTGRTVSVVKKSPDVENLINAYFAKKEYTKQTGEEAGILEYKFAGNGNKTENDAQKENIAKAILAKPNVVALKDKKQYTTIEAIKTALTATVYNKDQKITFRTFKLGEEFKRVNSASLEDKLYLVATTSMLEGKEASIIIKEKDGIIKGSTGAFLPVLEITEEQTEQKTTFGEVQGTEKNEFKGTVKDGIVKIPIHLRPKSDDELKQWKEKLAKGKLDGTYTYTFASQTALPKGSGDEKKRVAGAILTNAKEGKRGNPKIETGKTIFADDIEKALVEEVYIAGQTISFPLYKKETELLYLQAKAKGEKLHDKEFLKQDGAYFQIGKKCECEARIRAFMRTIRVAEGTGEYSKGTKEARNPQLGYTTWFSGGGNNFSDLSTHPKKINCNSTETLCSSASGAYQIMGWKFDELNGYKIEAHNDTYRTVKPLQYTESLDKAKKYNAKGFYEISQDRLCIIMLKDIGAIDSLLNNDIEKALDKSKGTWVSLPGATFGQPTAKMKDTLDYYKEFLSKELSGQSNLHINSDFLKEFGISCQCQESSNSNSSCPEDCSQCFDYSDVVSSPKLNDQSNNVNKNRFHRTPRYNNSHPNGYFHTGTDILTTLNTDLKSMLCGEVVEALNTGGDLGKIVTIKSKDKNGKFIWIRYCHLNSYSVSKGQKIKHGKVFGKSGNTGNAKGILPQHYHVHIEASTDGVFYGGNTRIDPEQFMKTKFDETTKGNPITK